MKSLFTLLSLLLITTSHAQTPGCTDILAQNYNALATVNDGSCTYAPATVTASSSFILSDTILETSGLIQWNNSIWTHNDNADLHLYALDTTNGSIQYRDSLLNASNIDMEEIAQDSLYIYLGDFGNNANGNRQNLVIYRLAKDSLLIHHLVVDTIAFSYADQTDFTPQGGFNTDFDCEAFIVTDDSIFLFTKQWISHQCTIYSMPKVPGTYSAQRRATYNVQGLTTGATYVRDKNLVVLVGYTTLLQPWFLLLYDYQGSAFFSGNKRKLTTSLGTSQTEGITSTDGMKFYVTNEKRTISTIVFPQQMHIFDLSAYTTNYLTTAIDPCNSTRSGAAFPNPVIDEFFLPTQAEAHYSICDMNGREVDAFLATSIETRVSVATLAAGIYFIRNIDSGEIAGRIIKK